MLRIYVKHSYLHFSAPEYFDILSFNSHLSMQWYTFFSKIKSAVANATAPEIVYWYLALYNILATILWGYILWTSCKEAYGFYTYDKKAFYRKSVLLILKDTLNENYRPHWNYTKVYLFSRLMNVTHGFIQLTTPSFLGELNIWKGLSTFCISYWRPDFLGNYNPVFMVFTFSLALSEMTHHFYEAVKFINGNVPRRFTWLRYSLFFVLYPIIYASENTVLYSSVKFQKEIFWDLVPQMLLNLLFYLTLCICTWRQRSKKLAKRNGDTWQPGEYQAVNLWRIVVLLLKLQLITDLSQIIGLHYRKLLQVTMEICN